MMGAEMSYQYLGNSKYKIVAKVYRDCNGVPFDNPSGTILSGNGQTSMSLGFKRVSIADITPTCKGVAGPCNPQNQRSGFGIEEHIFEAEIDISQTPYKTWIGKGWCEFTFGIGQCCRSGALTTIGQGNFWATSTINFCNLAKMKLKNNSSPVGYNTPQLFLCCNSAVRYNLMMVDTTDKFDSISYKLIPALQSLPKGYVGYNSPYTYKFPMKPYCVPSSSVTCKPNPNVIKPKGFYLDSVTGDLVFIPTKCDEVGAVVVCATEFRKDTLGNWLEIGNSTRDVMYIVDDACGYNNIPKLIVPQQVSACAGEKICFKIKSTDTISAPQQTVADTTLIESKINNSNTSFTIDNPKSREKTATFCWQTTLSDTSEMPYRFGFQVSDQYCPRPAFESKVVLVKVKRSLAMLPKAKLLSCGKIALSANPQNVVKGISYAWTITDVNKKLVDYGSLENDTLQLIKNGKYYIKLTTLYNCEKSYYDSITLSNFGEIMPIVSKSSVCEKDSISFSAQMPSTKAPYRFEWTLNQKFNTADTNKNFYINSILKTDKIELKISDGNNCNYKLKPLITIFDLPTVAVSPALAEVCKNIPVVFSVQYNDVITTLNWSNSKTSSVITESAAGKYIAMVRNKSNGCKNSDTGILSNNDTIKLKLENQGPLCGGGQGAKVKVVVPQNNRSLKYQWFENLSRKIVDTTNTITLDSINKKNPGEIDVTKKMYVKVIDVFGQITCSNLDSFIITVHTPPKLQMLSNPAICISKTDLNLVDLIASPAKSKLKQGKVSVQGINISSIGDPDVSIIDRIDSMKYIFNTNKLNNVDFNTGKLYSEKIKYQFTDKFGCYAIDSLYQIVNGKPNLNLKDTVICQNNGEIPLQQLNQTNIFNKSIRYWTFSCVSTPAGVSANGRVVNRGTFAQPNEYFNVGTVADLGFSGLYKIELNSTNNNGTCNSKDTVEIEVEDNVNLAHLTNNLIDDTSKSVDILGYFLKNGSKAKWARGDTIKISSYNGKYGSNPWNIKLVNNSFLNSSNMHNGTWRFVYENRNICGIYSDSVEVKIAVEALKIDQIMSNKISISPNPNNGSFELHLPKDLVIETMEIFDVKGLKVESILPKSLDFNKVIVDLPSGLYFLKVNEFRPVKFVILD